MVNCACKQAKRRAEHGGPNFDIRSRRKASKQANQPTNQQTKTNKQNHINNQIKQLKGMERQIDERKGI